MLDHSCQVQRAPLADRKDDLYETPDVAVHALLRVEKLPHHIWEPACGPGRIVNVLRGAGHPQASARSQANQANAIRTLRIAPLQGEFRTMRRERMMTSEDASLTARVLLVVTLAAAIIVGL